MQIQALTQVVHEIKSDVLIVGAVSSTDGAGLLLTKSAKEIDSLLAGSISESASAGEFTGKLGELLTVHSLSRLTTRRVIVVGLGKQNSIDAQAIRRASAIAARHAQHTGAQRIVLALQGNGSVEAAQSVQAEVEGALLGIYSFRSYQSDTQKSTHVNQIEVLSEGASGEEF